MNLWSENNSKKGVCAEKGDLNNMFVKEIERKIETELEEIDMVKTRWMTIMVQVDSISLPYLLRQLEVHNTVDFKFQTELSVESSFSYCGGSNCKTLNKAWVILNLATACL